MFHIVCQLLRGLLAGRSGPVPPGLTEHASNARLDSRLGTIDLRVDYLRPGLGQEFVATAEVTRLGGRIGSTQMRLANEQATLIATAAAAYVIS